MVSRDSMLSAEVFWNGFSWLGESNYFFGGGSAVGDGTSSGCDTLLIRVCSLDCHAAPVQGTDYSCKKWDILSARPNLSLSKAR